MTDELKAQLTAAMLTGKVPTSHPGKGWEVLALLADGCIVSNRHPGAVLQWHLHTSRNDNSRTQSNFLWFGRYWYVADARYCKCND